MKLLLSGVFAAVVFVAAAPPVTYAKSEIDVMSEIVGEAIGNIAKQTGALRACKGAFPDDATQYGDTIERYRELLSDDIATMKTAMRRIGSEPFFDMLWGAAHSIGYGEAKKAIAADMKNDRSPLAKCQNLLDELPANGARANATNLLPMRAVLPQKWKTLTDYANKPE